MAATPSFLHAPWDGELTPSQREHNVPEQAVPTARMSGTPPAPPHQPCGGGTGRSRTPCPICQGIQYLTEHKLLPPTAQDIAQFLYKGEGLNKTAIGNYLGER